MSEVKVKGLGFVKPLFKKPYFSRLPLVLIGIALALCVLVYLSAHYLLKPESAEQDNYIPDSATHKIVTGMKSVVDVCIQEYKWEKTEKCDELADIFEVVQGSLDLAAQTSMSQSTFGLLNIGYWQYIVTGFTTVFLFIAVFQTSLMLNEAKKTTIAADRTAKAAESAEKAHVFVTVDFVGLGQDADIYSTIAPRFRIANYGRTPALDVKGTAYLDTNINFSDDRIIHSYVDSRPERKVAIDYAILQGGGDSFELSTNMGREYFAHLDEMYGLPITSIIHRVIIAFSYRTLFQSAEESPVIIEKVVEARCIFSDSARMTIHDNGGPSNFTIGQLKDSIIGIQAVYRSRKYSDYDDNGKLKSHAT